MVLVKEWTLHVDSAGVQSDGIAEIYVSNDEDFLELKEDQIYTEDFEFFNEEKEYSSNSEMGLYKVKFVTDIKADEYEKIIKDFNSLEKLF